MNRWIGHFLVAMSALVTSAASGRTTESLQTTSLMDIVEKTASLPDGAAPLTQYDRYYTYMGDRTIIGIYVRTTDQRLGQRHWVTQKEMPQISGGGCSVVTVFYNPRTHKADSLCNFAM